MAEQFHSNRSEVDRASADPQSIDWFKATELESKPGNLQREYSNPELNCKPSPEYQEIIEKIAQNMFDPTKLGDKELLKNRFNCQIHSVEDAHKYARQVLQSIDKNGTVHTKEEVKHIRERLGEGFSGIGATVSRDKDGNGKMKESGPVTVKAITKDSPAAKAGVEVGDQITQVDGVDVANLSLEQTIGKVRGEKGTTVKLTIEGEEKPVEVTRDKVTFPSVDDRILPGNIGYLRFYSFEREEAAQELNAALQKYQNAKGLILDLRGNMGGRDTTAYLVSSLFLKEGIVHRTKTRLESPSESPSFDDTVVGITKDSIAIRSSKLGEHFFPRLNFQDKPTVILMDDTSASASEIVIGALQDNKAATTIGAKSYGKGDGQKILFDFPAGGITRITGSKGMTPNGHWFGNGADQRFGREPDIKVKNAPGTEYGSQNDEQLNAATEFLLKK